MSEPMPVTGLKAIHLPDPPSWWPPAPGWWWLSAGLILFLLFALFFSYYRRKTTLRRLALQALQRSVASAVQHQDDQRLLSELSILLRRVALAATQQTARAAVARLTGEAWLQFLDQDWPDKPFCQGIGRLLIVFPYQPPGSGSTLADTERTALLALCRRWLVRYSHPDKLVLPS
ncbi:MAG: DUF4381 domain-containing protein [Magnetococcales bacterium]|nr:DUF4381 domain-containing protein [Magnetococcales bacterium]